MKISTDTSNTKPYPTTKENYLSCYSRKISSQSSRRNFPMAMSTFQNAPSKKVSSLRPHSRLRNSKKAKTFRVSPFTTSVSMLQQLPDQMKVRDINVKWKNIQKFISKSKCKRVDVSSKSILRAESNL